MSDHHLSFWLLSVGCAAASCFDPASRWYSDDPSPPAPECSEGAVRCSDVGVEDCLPTAEGSLAWTMREDCAAQGLVCAPTLLACAECLPDQKYCIGLEVALCDSDGFGHQVLDTCSYETGLACRDGACRHLCSLARDKKSNVGCEYWAVDLDNATISASKQASSQQYAIVISNPQPDVPAEVAIFQDDGQPGSPAVNIEIARATIPSLNLRVFKLGPREVDGSPAGEYNTGTHTALTRHAYRVISDFPVVAYQFNPLENVNVFSNDASLLKPREALTYDTSGSTLSYVVASWPQTIAETDDPNTNFNPSDPISLRAFLTIVGTSSDTEVVIHPTTNILGAGDISYTPAGGVLTVTLDAFDVLNLETDDFNADFTGSLIYADAPVAVFTGSEASDAPHFETLADRRCCADHLEIQLDPIRTAGRSFALVHTPSRTSAVLQAGGDLGVAPEPEYFRFVAATQRETTVTTSLPAPDAEFTLSHIGAFREISSTRDFVAQSTEPIHVIQITASQDQANIPRGLPGGDPSLMVVTPREQYRTDYVFLTPDKYAFDFVDVVAPAYSTIALDGELLSDQLCEIAPADGLTELERGGSAPDLYAYRCQISFATIDDSGQVLPGDQNDGVHRIVSDAPIGVAVFGFDAYVSYGYAAGTELQEIALPE